MNKTIAVNAWEIWPVSQNEYISGHYPVCETAGKKYYSEQPSDVHTVLIGQGDIPDPAYGTNDKECVWIEKKAWIYKSNLTCGDAELSQPLQQLVFYGVDTFADLYINGSFIKRFENMFMKYSVDVSSCLKNGDNEILLVFETIDAVTSKKPLPKGFWINYSTERAFARKSGYSFGWDWTPRVATVGLWKPVEFFTGISSINEASLDVILEDDLSKGRVEVAVDINRPDGVTCICELFDREEKLVNQCQLVDGCGILEIEKPELWWTADLGDPYLYRIVVSLIWNNECISSREFTIGFRTLKIVKKAEDGEGRFLFVLNGKTLFLRGADWVPLSNRPGAVPDEMYQKIIGMAHNAGMNFLVAWGGGIYEKQIFFETCDKLGILVWQYFMFACGEYPDYDQTFVDLVHEECRQAVMERKHHPSIALWIGNVENEMICQKIHLDRPMHGATLFENLMPSWLADWDKTREYIPSSPWGETLMNSMTEYDRHNWDLWFGNHPYTVYQEDECCFCSEFGIHAAPVLDSVYRFCGTDKLELNDFRFKYLNRDADLDRMYYYLRTHTGEPKTVEEYVNLSMLVQAEALSFAGDHYRRRFPKCGGAGIWQLNDCCGAHSWSLIDYDGIPKASYYAVKRVFQPVCVNIRMEQPNHAYIYVCNNGRQTENLSVRVIVSDFFGEKSYDKVIEVTSEPGTVIETDSVDLGGRFFPNAILRNRPRFYFVAAMIEGKPDSLRVAYPVEEKDRLIPPSRMKAERSGNHISISTDYFLHFVHIESEDSRGLYPNDNYFDLLPGEQREIVIDGNLENSKRLIISALNCAEKVVL